MTRLFVPLAVLAAVLFGVSEALAVPVHLPGILVTDEVSDPFDRGDSRGIIVGLRYSQSIPGVTIAASPAGIRNPVVAALLPNGDLYVLDRGSDPLGLGRATGGVYLVDPSVRPTDSVGVLALASPLFVRPTDLLLDSELRILVLDGDADPLDRGGGPGALFRGDPETNNFEVIAADSRFRQPSCLANDIDGTLLVLDRFANPLGLSDDSPGALFRVDPESGDVTLVKAFDPDQLPDPRAVTVLPNGDFLVVDSQADPRGLSDGRGAVFLLSRTTGEMTSFIDDPAFLEPIDILVGEEDHLWILDRSADVDGSLSSIGTVFRFGISTRELELTQSSSLLKGMTSIAFAGGPSVDGSSVRWIDETGGALEPGNLVTVRATVRSVGTEDADGMVFTDTLGVEWNFVAGSDSMGTGTFDFDPVTSALTWKADVPRQSEETIRYRLRTSGALVDEDRITDKVWIWVGAVAISFSFQDQVAEPFPPGVVVFLDQRTQGGEQIGLIRSVDPNSLTPQTAHLGPPLVQPVDAVFLPDGLLAVLDLAAVPEQGTGAQAILLYDRAESSFEVFWHRAQGDPIVAPVGIALDLNGDLLLVDREANPLHLPYEPGPADFGPGAVFRIDRETGVLSTLFSDARMREPFGADVASDGTVVVADFTGTNGNGDLWEYHPDTGQVVRRFLNDTWFRDPIGVALDPVSGTAYVTDLTHYNDERESPPINNGTLLQVTRGNPSTYSILSQSARLVDPIDCFLAENGLLYVTDREANPLQLNVADPGAVFSFDLATRQLVTVAADFGVRRPAGPTGLGASRLEVGDLSLVDLNGDPVSPGDTLTFSIDLRNDGRGYIPEVVSEFSFSEPLVVESATAADGDILIASSPNRFSWVGRVGGGDTLRISGRATVQSGYGFGTPVTAHATVQGRNQVEEREVAWRLMAPFPPGSIFLADEAADPEGVGGPIGSIFGLSRDGAVSVLLTGSSLVDPSALLLRENGNLLIADKNLSDPGDVLELDPQAGTVRSILADNSALVTPLDLLFAPNGDLLVVDRDADPNGAGAGRGAIFRLAVGEDVPTLFSAASVFRFLSEAAFLADGRLFVTDRQADPGHVGGNSAAIFELDPETGGVLRSWQFPGIKEPTGLVAYQDTLLLVTDTIANPRGAQQSPGALFTFDPETRDLEEYLVNGRTVRPYRCLIEPSGSVLIVDQQATPIDHPNSRGIVFEYDPVARTLREFAWLDAFSVPTEIVQVPASLLRFPVYEVTDLDDAPLRSADRVRIRAELRNDGAISVVGEYEDALPGGVVPVPGTLSADSGTVTEEGGSIFWSGSLEPEQSVEISYEAQLDPVRVRDRVLAFHPRAVGPVVGTLEKELRVPVYVTLDPGNLYVLDADADPLGTGQHPGAILKVQQRSGTTATWFSDPSWRSPVSLAVVGETDPRVFLLDQTAVAPGGRRGVLFEIDPADLSTRVAAADSTWYRAESIVPFSDSELLLVDSWADPFELDAPVGPGAVYLVNPELGLSIPIASDTSWVRPIDIVQTKAGRWLLLDADADPLHTGQRRGAIFSLDIITGETTFFAASASWLQPVAITVAQDSTIYVVDQQATPSGLGRGSVWRLRDEPGTEPTLFDVSDEFVRPYDLVTQIDGDLVLVDSEASPGLQGGGRGALFLSQGQRFVPLAATSAMQEPRALVIYGDVTPIVDLALYATPVEEGVEVHWRGLAERGDTRYLVYRRVIEGPEVSGEPDLDDYELVPTELSFQGAGEHVLLDRTVAPDTWYAYVIVLVSDGPLDSSFAFPVRTGPSVLVFALAPATPNPFGTKTSIRFQIPRSGRVDLEIFDVGGRRVRRLVAEEVEAGSHEIPWDGMSDRSHRLASGVYFARLAWEGEVLTERIVRLR